MSPADAEHLALRYTIVMAALPFKVVGPVPRPLSVDETARKFRVSKSVVRAAREAIAGTPPAAKRARKAGVQNARVSGKGQRKAG